MNRRELQETYARQRCALELEHAQNGIDVFVSPFDILRTSDGVEQSYCTWPEGVASSLPRTDCIAFTGKRRDERWYLIVPWAKVVPVCGNQLERVPGVEPARFATVGWPDTEQLRHLDEDAIARK